MRMLSLRILGDAESLMSSDGCGRPAKGAILQQLLGDEAFKGAKGLFANIARMGWAFPEAYLRRINSRSSLNKGEGAGGAFPVSSWEI
jgi:hypothetical protein